MEHAYVIPAHRQSPYLRDCIGSLLRQTATSRIVLTTSTPSPFLTDMAAEFRLPLIVNPSPPRIASDWNFALTATDAPLVTLAHQDDLFAADYGALIRSAFTDHPSAVMAFTGHSEHTPLGLRRRNLNVRVKHGLAWLAFGSDRFIAHPGRKRRLVRWGNPICCPSVTINRQVVPDFRFSAEFEINLDWDAWTRLADHAGGFVYLPRPLVSHRIHVGTETTAGIADHRRRNEDLAMFRRFWPSAAARMILAAYQLSYRGNELRD